MTDYSKQREQMVERQIVARGLRSDTVLNAMRKVPREEFLPVGEVGYAYDDSPLPIGSGQTISQPYIVAYMAEALDLEGGEKVLEIGTGSGYAAAILAEIASEVYTVERLEELADRAAAVLEQLGYDNVQIRCGDGTLGWPEHAPYDGIVVTAGGPEVPETLKRQLKIGGRLVIPIGRNLGYQELVRVTRFSETDFQMEGLIGVCFVPLIGGHGWSSKWESLQGRTTR